MAFVRNEFDHLYPKLGFLCSAVQGDMVVPLTRISTVQHRIFAPVGPVSAVGYLASYDISFLVFLYLHSVSA